jgi:hypothetical protein
LAEKSGDLRRLLNLVRLDILGKRESKIFALRYGLPDSTPLTLDRVGIRSDLTKEGVRYILLRAHRHIVAESIRQLESGLNDQPCAMLALFIRSYVCPESSNSARRLAILLMEEFHDFCPSKDIVTFIASLAYPAPESVSCYVDSAVKILTEQHPGCMKHDMAIRRIHKLFSYVFWPTTPKRITNREMVDIRRKGGEPSNTGLSSYYSLKMRRFVKVSSRLEVDFYRLLEHSKEIIEYHAHPIAVLFSSGGRHLIYYPDLFLLLQDGTGIVTEITPLFRMALWWNLLKFEALRSFCGRVGFGLLITDGYSCFEEICQYKVNQRYTSEVMYYLRNKGALDWNTYKEMKDKHHANRKDFVGLVVQNRLLWKLGPFRLSLSNEGLLSYT